MDKLATLGRQYIEGEWIYNKSSNTLKKFFASSQELTELNLVNEKGYLNPDLKKSIINMLGKKLLKNIVGPFGDQDIFSGDVFDQGTLYNIELNNVHENTINELKKIPNIIIKLIEKLFSYGTLQYEAVQVSTFGRKLTGNTDILSGYKKASIQIKEIDVINKSGTAEHPILTYTGNQVDRVQGIVFDINEDELKKADEYEVSEYKRVKVKLNSGLDAWVYVSNTLANFTEKL